MIQKLALLTLLLTLAGPARGAPQTSVPFNFHNREVLVQATINGQGPFPMLLDTGTNPSIIDLALARKLGLALTSLGRGGTGGGTEKNIVYGTRLPSVGLGSLSDANIDALALDLSALSRRFGQPIVGVLGHSLLKSHVIQFDYPARVVRFFDTFPRSATATRTVLSFNGADGVYATGVHVNGLPVRAQFDTGSSSAFQLTPSAVRRLHLMVQARRARSKAAAGFNGTYAVRTGMVDSIMVGMLRVTRPAVTFWQPHTGHDSDPYDINIGNDFLRHCVLTIDYPRQRLALDMTTPR